MKKTFWSVDYNTWGNGVDTMWFEKYEDAKEFSKADFRDNPVKHTFSKPEKIKEIEIIISYQNFFA